jgi:hypothetical protein
LIKNEMNRSVYIIGAGCSAKHYPLAKDFREELRKYGDALNTRPNCTQLRERIGKTVELMQKYRSTTVDRLILQIIEDCDNQRHALRTSCVTPERQQLDRLETDRILDAKIATAAFFLERECTINYGLESYRDLLNVIFGGERGVNALKSTNHAVLSFNYDRLFEIAFGQYFRLDAWNCYGREFLNTGLDVDRPFTIDNLDRFCFLKLHGTAGTFVANQFGEPRYGHVKVGCTINDNVFWPSGKDTAEPLIVFPYEKERGVDSKTSFVFDAYIRAIWQEKGYAERLIEGAQQIRVIGYSFDVNDRKMMMRLLRQSNCPIIIQNKTKEAAEHICEKLRLDHPADTDLTHRLKPFGEEF